MNLYAFPGVPGHVFEGTMSDHTLGLAEEGSDGLFGESGTSQMSFSEMTKSAASHLIDETIWNRANYRGETAGCSRGPAKQYKVPIGYQFLPSDDYTSLSHPSFRYCQTTKATQTFDTASSKNITFEKGVSLSFQQAGATFNLSLTAQSRHGTSAWYGFKLNEPGQICYASSLGTKYSSQIEASPLP